MALVPCGKRRLMFGQAAPDPTHEMAGQMDTGNVQPGQAQMMDQQQTEADPEIAAESAGVEDPAGDLEEKANKIEEEQSAQAANPQAGGEKGGDVRTTVFDFLVSLGYPPRRLQEFKSQFVSETGSANSGTQVSIVVPDEVYGKNMQIPREKMKQFVQTVEKNHGLSFQDYKRANEQLTFNFMTADAAQQQSLEDAGPGDILDKVYGKPGKGSKGKPNPKQAGTIQEFIKESKSNSIPQLLRILQGAKQ